MEHMWAPWRMDYVSQIKAGEGGCFLCEEAKGQDDARVYILHREELNFVIMNRYPYNPGHLLVAPYRHIGGLDEMTAAERQEHFDLVSRSVDVLKEACEPQGFTIGINLGRVAGAGLVGHVHTHIVPRWQGDTNFMPVISECKIVPQALEDTYKALEGRF